MLQFKPVTAFFLLFVHLKFAHTENAIIDLNGVWYIKSDKYDRDLKATVPGGIYTDLMNNEIIEDIFFRFNDVETRWVSKENWTYTRQFSISDDVYDHEIINLVFNGLDTFAEIFVNNRPIGTTENMFVQYVFDVKSQLEVGNNNITVKFVSPVTKASLLFEKQAKDYIVPPECVPASYNGECHVNHIRKMQASFSWDWGPAFPSVGIWKDVYLEANHIAVIRDITVNVQENTLDDTWDIATTIYFSDSPTDELKGNVLMQVKTDFGVIKEVYDVDTKSDENDEYLMSETVSIPKNSVKLWWPNGYGKPVLYEMKVKFVTEEGDVSAKEFKIGFRTVELVQDNITEGMSFYFMVNKVPIFAKGCNSIPLSVLPEKGQDIDTIKFLLESARDVHMNMIRVWGGGVYESDQFYEIADSLGIMIWQDFMFACSMYPTNEEFLETVQDEVRHQVRRLQYHPSIILWAANNENEAALRQNWYGTSKDFEKYHEDFIKLYVDTIRKEVFESDKSRQFLTSSPTNGVQSEESDYVATDPQSHYYGDVHYYNYFANPWQQSNYPVPRFSSEYGYQSLPSMSTLRTSTNVASDLQYNSNFSSHRQHAPGGNAQMRTLLSYQFVLPDMASENFYETFVFYGQILQAMAIKKQTEYYRIWKSNYLDSGKGLTMGALYWQLNDVWVAPTWSGIDFENNWKMLHYYAKEFFSPVIITPHILIDGDVDLYVVSDLLTNSYNDTATISIYNWNSFNIVNQTNVTVNVLANYSKKIYSFWMIQDLMDAGCGTLTTVNLNCFIRLSLTNKYNEAIAPDNFIYPIAIKSAAILTTQVKVTGIMQLDKAGKLFAVEVWASGISLFVWLEVDGIKGIFSDNGFVQYTQTKVVKFNAESPTDVNALKSAITVTHYRDTLYSD